MPKTTKKKAALRKRPTALPQVYRVITLRVLDEAVRCGVGTKNDQRQPVYAFITAIITGRLLKAKKGKEVKAIIGQYSRMPAFREFKVMLQESPILRPHKTSEYLP
jgi:hypothetical protein